MSRLLPSVPLRIAPGPRREWLIFLAFLILATILTYGRVLTDLGGTVFAHNDDSSLFIFWIAHAADVTATWLGFGSGERNYLYTTSMNYPTGVSGAWNTSMVGLGLPLVPVTWVFGPVVSYNLAIIIAPAACAIAAAWALTQFLPRPAAFVGSFAYGFSTYVISQSAGHLNLAFAVLSPLILGFVTRLLAGRGSTWKNGLGLGLAVGWQFYLSTELLANTFVATVIALLCAAATQWSRVRGGLKWLLRGGLIAVGVALILGAPLIATMLVMPGRPRAEIRPHGIWNNDLADPVTPGVFTLLGGGEQRLDRAMTLDPSEIGAYVGWAWLLLALIVGASVFRHPRYGAAVRTAGLSALVIFLVSMGSPWRLNGEKVLDPSPYRFIEYLPIFEHVLPMRMSVHVTLALTVLMGVGIAVALRSTRRPVQLGAAALTLTALLTTTSGSVQPREVNTADFYSSGIYRDYIPAGAVVKMLPTPVASDRAHTNESLVNQAITGMHFKQTGGYFIGSTADHPVIYQSLNDPLDTIVKADENGYLPAGDTDRVKEAIAQLRAAGITHVAITDGGYGLRQPAGDIARMVALAAGTSYQEVGGVYLITLQ